MGKLIEPILTPLGYDWKIGIALISSFAAREVFVGTLATIYNVQSDKVETIKNKMASEVRKDGKPVFNFATGISLMLFYTFAMQCMSTLAIVKKETNTWKWPLIQLLSMTFLAYIIKKVYLYSSQSLSNKEYFSDLFVPLSIITCLVITVIKFSLALSLGLVGALSIVRFRAAIKEPEELIYLFLIIGIGLASGANQFMVAIIATISISIILVLFSLSRRGKYNNTEKISTNIVQIEVKNKQVSIKKILEMLQKNCEHVNLKSSNLSDNIETYVFWVEIKNKTSLLKSIETFKKISSKDLTISLYTSENIHE